MNLYFKFLLLILKRIFWAKTQAITDPCSTSFRVGVFDLDLNFHMNNGRYFSIMDLGRFDMLLKTRSLFRVFRRGYYPVVLSESMVFKKSLNYFAKYQLQTKIESWDDKFFYMTQIFMQGDEIMSTGHVRACFKQRGQRGIVPTQEFFSFFKIKQEPIYLSTLAKKQIELDETLSPRNLN